MAARSGKNIDVARLKADVAAAGVELLSAHCAIDRIRMQHSPQDIVAFGDRHALQQAITSAEAVCRFFSQIAHYFNRHEDANR
ncbi:MAG TPA: hypothetical protein VH350_03540 [Candidatus Sulfotelmatobacter sp.]|jgi:hypothetical protein|nr:hypothetical protein [Candidatus Sulfotelmatobacter sp.]